MFIPKIILIKETIDKFGYDPSKFKGLKDYKKIIIRTCLICSNIYEQQFISTVRAYNENKKCKFCANKERALNSATLNSNRIKEKIATGRYIPPMLGKKHSEEVKLKAHNRLIGKTFEDLYGKEKSDIIKQKLSKKLKNNNLGKKHTDETKKKMSQVQKTIARKGSKCNFYGKNYNKILTNEEFIKRAKNKHNNLYDYSISNYIGNNKSINIICKIHGTFSQIAATHMNSGCGCPKCNLSKNEIKISNFLDENNISYISQYRFKYCKNTNTLPFDFYLPEYNTCIEYDGEFHFKDLGFNKLEQTIKNDEIKTKYCKDNNIKLIRITYLESDNIFNILNENIQR